MNASWVAGTVRSRLLLERRIGADGARALAGTGSLVAARDELAGSAYGSPELEAATVLETAQRAVAAQTLLWLRVLAAWLPRGALGLVRALAAWFELVNVEDRLAYLRGSELRPPFEIGALSTSWPALSRTQSTSELRDVLGASVWGDPGGEEPAAVHLGLRLAWTRRVLASVPEAAPWAAGALALLLARDGAGGASTLPAAARSVPVLGGSWGGAVSIGTLRAELPPSASWALRAVESHEDLWQAEAAWWQAVEHDADALARGPLGTRGPVVGTIALLGLDAVRVRAALAAADADERPQATEALHALL